MKILVTGSSGFIGKALTKHLANLNYDVYGLDIVKSDLPQFAQIDILDFEKLYQYCDLVKPDMIVHLAARIDISTDSVVKYNANIEGVSNLIKVTENISSISRVIWTSSQLVNRLGVIDMEGHSYIPDSSYGESKVMTELLVKKHVTKKEWILVRPTTVWGPGMSGHYQNLLKYIEKGWYFNISTKKIFKTFSYVENICFQYEKLISASSSDVDRQIYYLCDYEPFELREWINSLAKNIGTRMPFSIPFAISKLIVRCLGVAVKLGLIKKSPLSLMTLKNVNTQFIIDNTKLKKITGELPFNLQEATKRTVQWWKSNN